MEQFNAMHQDKLLVDQLTQGWETANQLKGHLPDDVNSEALIQKILSTYDKALAMLTGSWRAMTEEDLTPNSPEFGTGRMSMGLPSPLNHPHSPIASTPSSEVSNGEKRQKNVSRKRKISAKWNQEVQVCSVRQDGVSLDDGYSWRKYGQKDILGATHPRNYYRCTHRNSRGCLATKQVQRKDEDPSTLEIIYKGKHTCSYQTANSTSTITFSEPEKPTKSRKTTPPNQEVTTQQQTLQNLAQGLTVETDHSSINKMNTNIDQAIQGEGEVIFHPFSFPFTTMDELENQQDVHFFSDAELMDGCSPTTTTTSDSCYFSSSSPFDMISSKYDLTNLITTPTSAINSPFEELDHFLVDDDLADCDPNIPLDSFAYLA
ncbi:OLC1v1038407C1 [Oldenlandia corymbosa var. corymbosa]|uniref:OLC1v1038407C1 n=1 Tax=Oldenlandia corymbosa var. corymbosa TaxID=529605 RepID=A0AAV1D0X3_OLDCO|nr:OLC1v1038407C1 [Oldenlandia corymbosa var. corymbosa]